MTSVLRTGSFTHNDNEANLVGITKRTIFSPRNKAIQQEINWSIQGEIQQTSTALIISRIAALEAAYSTTISGDATYSIDGAVAHRLSATGSASGVQVAYAAFPRGDGAELATKRTFAVKLRSIYDASALGGGADDLVSWQESVSTESDGGPYVLVTAYPPGIQSLGGVVAIQLAPRTPQFYTQVGSAVGYTNWPAPPGPVNPAGNLGFLTRITYGSGRQTGNGIRYFTTRWFYRMARDLAVFGSFDAKPTSK